MTIIRNYAACKIFQNFFICNELCMCMYIYFICKELFTLIINSSEIIDCRICFTDYTKYIY